MSNIFWPEFAAALDLPANAFDESGAGELPSVYPVSAFASSTIGAAGTALAALAGRGAEHVQVDRRRASLWFGMTVVPVGWNMPSIWDPIAGVYGTSDGFIRLHTNAPHHRDAALSVLECANTRDAVAARVAQWRAEALEHAVVAAGGCAAMLRTRGEWMEHPQGIAVRAAPLINWHTPQDGPSCPRLNADAPLAGLKVLDLTRVLAGPVASRFLAGYRAEVLRIDPPHWSEPAAEIEVTLGKRCAGLDLHRTDDRATFETLIASADVLLHGYRPGALERLGYGPETLRALNPGLINVSLSAYGRSGPWGGRRGFDSLVQMSCGIAAEGRRLSGGDAPLPLPVQALDHGTGYLMAAAVLRAMGRRAQGEIVSAELSLARTAETLMGAPGTLEPDAPIRMAEGDLAPEIEETGWGPARRVAPPLRVAAQAPVWGIPAGWLRRDAARWRV